MHTIQLFFTKNYGIFSQAGNKMGASSFLATNEGGYSQNFLHKFVKIAVTLGLNILRFYQSKVFFQSKYR